jgi:tRNA threonylcarbamoyladenosine biosynthesis protein TsaE
MLNCRGFVQLVPVDPKIAIIDVVKNMSENIHITSYSVEDTKFIGAQLGRSLRGGELIELVSDVGGGKTTITKGIAEGLKINETVQSPTFTISRLYQARDGLELHHFDFYRLQDAGIMSAELAESVSQPNAIVVIEWAGVVEDVLPAEKIKVEIKSIGENDRLMTVSLPDGYDRIGTSLRQFAQTKDIA